MKTEAEYLEAARQILTLDSINDDRTEWTFRDWRLGQGCRKFRTFACLDDARDYADGEGMRVLL